MNVTRRAAIGAAATLPFLLLRAIGDAYVARDVDLADIAAFLDGELAA